VDHSDPSGMGVLAEIEDFVDAVRHGDFEYAFGGLPPDFGGVLADIPMAGAKAEIALAGAGSASAEMKAAAEASGRANEIHSVLDPIAQNSRTTAVLETNGGRVVAGGARDLSPPQHAALRPGETAARAAGQHAEITAVQHAQAAGLTPRAIATSRPFCSDCETALKDLGATITSKTTAIWKDLDSLFK
jgi:hypothetical protein